MKLILKETIMLPSKIVDRSENMFIILSLKLVSIASFVSKQVNEWMVYVQ